MQNRSFSFVFDFIFRILFSFSMICFGLWFSVLCFGFHLFFYGLLWIYSIRILLWILFTLWFGFYSVFISMFFFEFYSHCALDSIGFPILWNLLLFRILFALRFGFYSGFYSIVGFYGLYSDSICMLRILFGILVGSIM